MPALQKPQKLVLLLIISVQRVTLSIEGGIKFSLGYVLRTCQAVTLSTGVS